MFPRPITRSQRRVRGDRQGDFGDARGVQEGQVGAIAQRLGGDDLQLAAFVRAEDRVARIKAEGLCV